MPQRLSRQQKQTQGEAPREAPRTGPRPLALHLMMGLSASLSLPFTLPNLKSASPGSKPENTALLQKLQELLDGIEDPGFETALGEEAVRRSHAYLAGIKAYRQHPAVRDVPEAPVVWREGTTRLRDYNSAARAAPVLLVIPSLINRFDILDLDFAPSFLRTLASAGMRPLVVDWDMPGEIEAGFALDDYVARLVRIADWLKANGASSGVNLLGYCMGGLLALALANSRSDQIKTLTLLATPWDFHEPDPTTGRLLAALAENWGEGWDAAGVMPVDIIQYLFALLQPFQAVAKFIDFAALDPGSMEARQFVLIEDWLNDGVPLPAKVARACLQDWYGDNLTAKFNWRAGGRIVDPRTLSIPSYVVVPGRDRIVPPESARPLAKFLPRASLHEPMTGHIGMMASRNASHQVWKPLLRWLEEHV
jgi:polyhydroxyalkanoate synthase subunit PhaC